MFKRFGKQIGVAMVLVTATASASFAALDLTAATVNTADVESIMELVIPALLVLWGFRKVVKVTNRS